MQNYNLAIDTIKTAKTKIQSFLAQNKTTNPGQASTTLDTYAQIFEGNFVSWMAGAVLTARSPYARYAASENLWVELKDDHPGMLRAFIESCQVKPQTSKSLAELEQIRKQVGELSGLKNIALMAILENTSEIFIPHLATLAKQLGCQNFQYTDTHGAADILHAEQFTQALEEEIEQSYPNAQTDIAQITEVTINLLMSIFSTESTTNQKQNI